MISYQTKERVKKYAFPALVTGAVATELHPGLKQTSRAVADHVVSLAKNLKIHESYMHPLPHERQTHGYSHPGSYDAFGYTQYTPDPEEEIQPLPKKKGKIRKVLPFLSGAIGGYAVGKGAHKTLADHVLSSFHTSRIHKMLDPFTLSTGA